MYYLVLSEGGGPQVRLISAVYVCLLWEHVAGLPTTIRTAIWLLRCDFAKRCHVLKLLFPGSSYLHMVFQCLAFVHHSHVRTKGHESAKQRIGSACFFLGRITVTRLSRKIVHSCDGFDMIRMPLPMQLMRGQEANYINWVETTNLAHICYT